MRRRSVRDLCRMDTDTVRFAGPVAYLQRLSRGTYGVLVVRRIWCARVLNAPYS